MINDSYPDYLSVLGRFFSPATLKWSLQSLQPVPHFFEKINVAQCVSHKRDTLSLTGSLLRHEQYEA